MILRISKNLKGSICIPSISQRSFTANQTFYVDENNMPKDVQNGISKKMIIPVDKDNLLLKNIVYITNISRGSVVISGIGAIQTGETRGITELEANSRPIKELEQSKIIRLSKRAIVPEKRKPGRPRKDQKEDVEKPQKKDKSEWNPIAWTPLTEDGEVATKELPKLTRTTSPVTKKANYSENPDNDDNIEFVDVEQTQKLVTSHPVLRKKNSKNADDSIKWVDVEDIEKRIAAHPVLRKKNANK